MKPQRPKPLTPPPPVKPYEGSGYMYAHGSDDITEGCWIPLAVMWTLGGIVGLCIGIFTDWN
jgi:hypothetical protein